MPDDQEHFGLTDSAFAKSILIVGDEDSDAQLLMHMLLQEAYFHVFLATNIVAAVKFTQYIKPHLFLFACRLPDRNCINLYKHLHMQRELEAIPALFMRTCLKDVVDDSENREWLAFGKLFDQEECISTLEEIFSRET